MSADSPRIRSVDLVEAEDSDQHFFAYFNNKQREYVRTVLCDDLIEEYRKKPLGHHSEPLERTLAYFRRLPLAQQYALHKRKDGTYRIVSMSGIRGSRPNPVGAAIFTSLEDAYVGVFLQQVQDVMERS